MKPSTPATTGKVPEPKATTKANPAPQNSRVAPANANSRKETIVAKNAPNAAAILVEAGPAARQPRS